MPIVISQTHKPIEGQKSTTIYLSRQEGGRWLWDRRAAKAKRFESEAEAREFAGYHLQGLPNKLTFTPIK